MSTLAPTPNSPKAASSGSNARSGSSSTPLNGSQTQSDGSKKRRDSDSLASRLNWLRAAVLGANDGIVSIAGVVVGVSGAQLAGRELVVAGLAALVAGALSMAAGEYVSVSTQRDTERAALKRIRTQVATDPDASLAQLTGHIHATGISSELARQVAEELTAKNAEAAHARYELTMDSDELTNPWHAAWASMFSFIAGALIPFLVIIASPKAIAVPATVTAVTVALALTGSLSAKLGGSPRVPATIRNIFGGLLAMGVTYGIGALIA